MTTVQPARADQGCLDEVMAEDVAAEGGLARQVRQARGRHEGFGPDDGVVAQKLPSFWTHQDRPVPTTGP